MPKHFDDIHAFGLAIFKFLLANSFGYQTFAGLAKNIFPPKSYFADLKV